MIDEIDGLDELLRACVKIEKDTAKRIEEAVRPLMEALNAEAKNSPHIDTGALQQSFDFKLNRRSGGTIVWGIQGVRMMNGEFCTDKGKRVPWRYFHLVNDGTVQRKTAKGYNRGSVNPTLFYTRLMEKYDPLLKQAVKQVLDEIETEIP
jgi:hypothetical protein